MIKKICHICSKVYFVPIRRKNLSKYCSNKCKWIGIKGNNFNDRRIKKSCLWCKKSFLVSPCRVTKSKYCGFSCYWKSKKGKPTWNKDKKLSKEHREKLSLSHLGKKIGKNNPNWRGGISIIDHRIRACKKYKLWRTSIFEKDNYTCTKCGVIGVYITAHHIKSFTSILKECKIDSMQKAYKCNQLWNLKNGITLCEPCHKKTDNYKGRAVKIGRMS